MAVFLQLLKAFVTGGIICAAGQILIDKTSITPARILTCYVVLGVFLGAVGIYEPLTRWAGAGATVPLTGFGYNLAKGVKRAVLQKGVLGALTGGITSAAGGITAAIVFGWIIAVLFKSGDKS
ncbi:MAG: stage V sporulation protein AE [Oscillospiraceae bacterium]|nr:stage V sporulation protein AE [Oscillospiraceae bacterium]